MIAALFAGVACGGDSGNGPEAKSIEVSPNGRSIKIGESLSLVATPVDAKGNVIGVTGQIAWSSSAAAIATVDANGKVVGVSAGTADITAAVAGLSGSARITVLAQPVARLDVTPTPVSFTRSQTRQLTATAFAADNTPLAGRTITWTSSNLSIVTLSSATGATVTLTAVAPGSATVSAASEGITRDVPVTVAPDPVITFTPASATFGSTAGGPNPSVQTVNITNTGGGTLNGLAAGTITYTAGQPTGWLTAAFEGGTNAPAALTLRATTGTLPLGAYSASVPVSSTAPGAASKNLAVAFNIGSPVMLGATPTTASFTAPGGSGNPGSQAISIFSANGSVIPNVTVGAIEYAGAATGWLTATLSGSTTPATLTLQPSVGSLASGTYTANVPIVAPTAANSPLKVAVTFVVPQPFIALSATTRSFIAAQSIGSAAGQVVTVSNGGRGTLSGLQVAVSYGAGATNWLSANLSSGTAPATLTLTPVANTIARGTYSATVQISAPGVANSPQSVGVTYQLVYTFDTHIAGTLASTAVSGCSNASCHKIGGQNPVMAAGSGDVYARLLSGYVSPGSLAGSLLYSRVSSTTSPMPPSGMVPAIRDAIAAWILDGARRN